jgi:hypothetical protein
MKKTAIFKAIMALFVIMLGVNFNADAQIGKNLLDKAKKAGNNAVKEAKQETSSNALKDKATDAAKGAGEGAIKDKWEKETADLFCQWTPLRQSRMFAGLSITPTRGTTSPQTMATTTRTSCWSIPTVLLRVTFLQKQSKETIFSTPRKHCRTAILTTR